MKKRFLNIFYIFIAVILFVGFGVEFADAVGEKVTIPGLKKEQNYTRKSDEQDYLSLSGWTDCPAGYVITGGITRAYNKKNKNLNGIECTRVDGLTGPIRVVEFNHTIKSYAELFGPSGTGYQCSMDDLNCSIVLGLKRAVDYCMAIGPQNWNDENQCDLVTWVYSKPRAGGGQLSQGLYGCPENYAMVGVLKRSINRISPDSPLDNNITMVKCQAFSKPAPNQDVDEVRLNDNEWGYCPEGQFARGLVMINHNSGVKPQSLWSWTKETLDVVNNFARLAFGDLRAIYDLVVYFIDYFSDLDLGNRELYNFTERGLLCNQLPNVNSSDSLGVKFAYPQDGAVVTSAPLKVSVSPSKDAQGRLPSVKIINITTGYQGEATCGGFGCVDTRVTLSPGYNQIRSEVTYANGEVRSSEIRVNFDKFAAKINFVHPVEGNSYTTGKDRLDLLIFTLQDVDSPEITSITWSRSTSDRSNVQSGTGSVGFGYVLQNINLDPGLNIIDIVVRYKSNTLSGKTNASFYVTREGSVDGTFGTQPPPPPAEKTFELKTGDRIKLVTSLNVRNDAAGQSQGSQNQGAQGTIINKTDGTFSGTIKAFLFTWFEWYRVNFDAGVDGWIAAYKLDGSKTNVVKSNVSKIGGAQPPPPETLSAPQNLQASGQCAGSNLSRINVSWSGVGGATRYEVHRKSNDNITPYAEIQRTSNTSFVDTTVSQDQSYRYKVRACNSATCSTFQTNYVLGTAPNCAPPPPSDTTPPTVNIVAPYSGLAATTPTIAVLVGTSDNSGTASTMKIENRTTGYTSYPTCTVYGCNDFAVPLTSGSNTIRATATDPSGNSAFKEVIVTYSAPSLSIPSNLRLTEQCSGSTSRLVVQWNSVSGANEYEIHRKPHDSVTPYQEVKRKSNTTFWDATVTPGQSYRYKVRASNTATGVVSGFQSQYVLGTAPNCGASYTGDSSSRAQLLESLQTKLLELKSQLDLLNR